MTAWIEIVALNVVPDGKDEVAVFMTAWIEIYLRTAI